MDGIAFRERRDLVEAVHPAAVVLAHEGAMLMVNVVRVVEIDRPQAHDAVLAALSILHGIGAGKPVEEIVDAAVFLNDDDDVLDVRAFDRRALVFRRAVERARAGAATPARSWRQAERRCRRPARRLPTRT